MPTRRHAILLALLAAGVLPVSPAAAQPRTWRSADGTGSFVGEYLRHDARRVTIRRKDDRVFTLDLAKLHPDDQAWLKQQGGPAALPADPVAADENAVFDTLKLGDLYADVTKKLAASQALELTVAETYLGRLGLNGSYRTRQQIGGQHCLLFFDWSTDAAGAASRLRELSLQTEPADASNYATRLRATWTEFADLLTKLHGPPLQAAGFPPLAELSSDGICLSSHLWRLDGGHSALLGTARDAGRYSVVVRFTTEAITPIMLPPP